MEKEGKFSKDSSPKEKTNSKEKKKNFSIQAFLKPLPIAIVLLSLLIIFLSYTLIHKQQLKSQFENDYLKKAELNEKQIFHISKIYCYSSASPETNQTTQGQWDLNISQFTDIAIYLQADQSAGTTEENTIQKMALYDIQISNNEEKNAALYFKDLSKFGRFDFSEENKIDGTLNYEIINSYALDYSKPQIYMGANNPIAIQFVRKNVREHFIINDLSTPILYDGRLLKQANIPSSALETNLSFKILIVNQANQEFIANVYLSIPLEEEQSIYDGYCVKEILNPAISFYRVK